MSGQDSDELLKCRKIGEPKAREIPEFRTPGERLGLRWLGPCFNRKGASPPVSEWDLRFLTGQLALFRFKRSTEG